MNYRIIDGADKMNTAEVAALLKTTYWANKRSIETIEASMRNSACYGVYLDDEKKLVGFARVTGAKAWEKHWFRISYPCRNTRIFAACC